MTLMISRLIKVQQGDSQQYQADDQGGKHRVQAGDGEVFLVFASAGDADAPVQPLLIFIQISFKSFLFIFVDPDGSLAYALVGEESVEGIWRHIVIDAEGCLRAVGAAQHDSIVRDGSQDFKGLSFQGDGFPGAFAGETFALAPAVSTKCPDAKASASKEPLV